MYRRFLGGTSSMASTTMKSATKARAEAPVLVFRGQKEWASWLNENHRTSPGLWLQIGKKGSALESLSYAEALEVALCYGWIDGQKRAHDDASWLQRFTPRGPNSVWSRINRDKAEDLIRGGRMKPAGLDAIERAQENGRWEAAYDSPRRATVPSDFQAALNRNRKAKSFFSSLDRANRYAILWRIQTAKKAETRARKIQEFIQMLARGEKIHA
jgi:uncharacterized protein YdeI (YjbR/CyaY-like superfamily)